MKRIKFRGVLSLVIILAMLIPDFSVFAEVADASYCSSDGSAVFEIMSNSADFLTSVEANPPYRGADSAIHITGTGTSTTENAAAGGVYIKPCNKSISAKHEKVVVSLDFYGGNEGNGFTLRGQQYGGVRTAFAELKAGRDFEKGTWNRVDLVLSSNGTDKRYDVYINGKIHSHGNGSEGAYGLENSFFINLNANNGSEYDAYFDNISFKGVSGYIAPTQPVMTSDSFEIEGNYINVLAKTSVESLLAGVKTDANSTISLYDAEKTLVTDNTATISGFETLVIKNSDGIFNFYRVSLFTEKSWSGSETVSIPDNTFTVNKSVADAPFKTSGDVVYQVTGTAPQDMASTNHGKGYINLDLGSIIGDTKAYDTFSVEFDFYLTNAGTGLSFRGQQCIEGKDTYGGTDRQDFVILKVGDTFDGKVLESKKWYRLSIISDADNAGDDKGIAKIYVNGIAVGETALKENAYGFKQFGWINPYVKINEDYELFLDNISVNAGKNIACTSKEASVTGTDESITFNGSNKIYGIDKNATIEEILEQINVSSNTAEKYIVDSENAVMASSDTYASGCTLVLKSSDGLYSYYGLTNVKYYKNYLAAPALADSALFVTGMGSDDGFYEIPTEGGKISIEFNKTNLDEDTLIAENFVLTLGGESVSVTDVSYKTIGGKIESVEVSLPELLNGSEYALNISGIKTTDETPLEMTGTQQVTFVTVSSSTGVLPMMPNLIINKKEVGAWQPYSSFDRFEHKTESGMDVISTTGRTAGWHGFEQKLTYDKYYKYTGDLPGETSKLKVSYKLRRDSTDTYEGIILYYNWIVDGVKQDFVKISNTWPIGNTWEDISQEIEITVPEGITDNFNSYIVFHFEGATSTSENIIQFSIGDCKIQKPLPVTGFTLDIDDTVTVNTIQGNRYGYAFEPDEWYWPSQGGATISSTSNVFKDSFLSYATDLGIDTIRLGGYMSNFDFWKASIGPVENRIPTKAFKPAWDTTKDYWRDGIHYLGNMEALELAENINRDVEVVMCVNMYSYLKDVDYSNPLAYTEAITPTLVVDVENQSIDEAGLEVVINDILDFVRFTTLTPDDPKAIGKDGTNWAQKRVDSGHEEPYNVTIWELGNELELRGITAATYNAMCKKIIPALRAEFPEIKLAVAGDILGRFSNGNWDSEIIDEVEYITTHKYYMYDEVELASKKLTNLQDDIEVSTNPELKILMTEGGLDTFGSGGVAYYGPSSRSLGMCTSYAHLMNNAAPLSSLYSFNYYGSPVQFSYNAGEGFDYGWKKFGTGVEVLENDVAGVKVISTSGRYNHNTGMQQKIPLSKLIGQGHNIGEDRDYAVSYDIMFETEATDSAVEPMAVIFALYKDTSANPVSLYSKVFNTYNSGEWINASGTLNIEIPSGYDENSYILISIKGNKSVQAVFSEANIKNLTLASAGNENIALNRSNMMTTENDNFRNTALADLIQFYNNKATGDVVYTENLSREYVKDYVSHMAVKTEDGIRLFVANLDTETDYTMALNSSKNYALTGKFMITGNGIYSERKPGCEDIRTVREYYSSTEPLETVVIPKNTVLALELTDLSLKTGKKIADSIVVENGGIVIKKAKEDKRYDLIASFEGKDGKQFYINSVEKDNVLDFNVSDISEFNKLSLFKWNLNENLFPFAEKEVYNFEKLFPALN